MDYQKPIVLVQELAANSTFWLMFGISFFNVTWMKFERNVRLRALHNTYTPHSPDSLSVF